MPRQIVYNLLQAYDTSLDVRGQLNRTHFNKFESRAKSQLAQFLPLRALHAMLLQFGRAIITAQETSWFYIDRSRRR